jgi:hypothetical protein
LKKPRHRPGLFHVLRDYIPQSMQAKKSRSRIRTVVIAGRAWGALMKATLNIFHRFDPVGRNMRRAIAPTG